MTSKKELKDRLNKLSDKEFIKYLLKTTWCFRETLEMAIDDWWSEEDIIKELEFLKKENIGN